MSNRPLAERLESPGVLHGECQLLPSHPDRDPAAAVPLAATLQHPHFVTPWPLDIDAPPAKVLNAGPVPDRVLVRLRLVTEVLADDDSIMRPQHDRIR